MPFCFWQGRFLHPYGERDEVQRVTREGLQGDDLRPAPETRAQRHRSGRLRAPRASGRKRLGGVCAAGMGSCVGRAISFSSPVAQFGARSMVSEKIVAVLQQFALGKSEAGVDFDFLLLLLFLRLLALRVQGFGQALARFGLLAEAGAAVDLRQQQAHDALEHLRIAPENVEGLIEQFLLLALDRNTAASVQ